MKAVFSHPDWEAIRGNGQTAVDMHFHTDCSDSFTDVESALRLAEERGVGLAVTDHNLIGSLVKIRDRPTDVMVIPGMEISTSDGPHILAYFYSMDDLESFWRRSIRPRLQRCPWLALRDCPTERLLDMLEEEQCVVSAAHPMGYLMSNKGVEVCIRKGYLEESVTDRLDAYEVICSGMTRESNIQALRSARRYGLGFTGGTDGHTLKELGNVVTMSDASDPVSFLDDIAAHRTDVVGIEKTMPKKIGMATASLTRFAMHSPSAIYVQTNQAVRSAERGGKKAAGVVMEKTNEVIETAAVLETRIRELGKR